ncbi:MAG: PAAR domain-containing protein [Pseudomonas sp.]|nr:MAG: PAAR domain-containing protein [Pseudomonas sp.]
MRRANLKGKGQALDGDLTTSGATCIASLTAFKMDGFCVVRVGDSTTPCPLCSQVGTVVEGMPGFNIMGKLSAMDGARVACGCPDGSRVVAPLENVSAMGAAAAARAANTYVNTPTQSSTHSPLPARFTQGLTSSPPQVMDPGFYIVQRSMSFEQVLAHLSEQPASLPRSILQRLNPTYAQGFKAGEMFVLGDPRNGHACTRQELQAMSAAEIARQALADLTNEEADFMMRHQAEIGGLLSDVSLSIGVAQAMMAKSRDDLNNTLRQVEILHQQQFSKYGHLRSPEFFATRKELFKRMDTQLRMSFLNKRMELGSHDTLRRDLGISSKSLVHHWNKAGGPGQIPGYATHLEKIGRMTKYLKAGGQVGIVIGAGSAYFRIREACQAGETEACRQIKFTEAGSFAGGLAGGYLGGVAGQAVAVAACIGTGPAALVCGVAVVGAGALLGSMGGASGGEVLGEVVFEALEP